MSQQRFRYRTAILVGPWRDSKLKAECDAVAAGQAQFEGRGFGQLSWRIEGEIEAETEDRRA